ncbi:trehalase-like domain-containing protein [Nonomuraea jabiensis]|uniref:trehalase-like domain-containing protein n=1 Tax=Nonomuraea jabiensis TaxID=882448 RepID=UPI003D75C99B
MADSVARMEVLTYDGVRMWVGPTGEQDYERILAEGDRRVGIYRALWEYALIADGERGAVVGPRGELRWMCTPHWDSEAIFSSLIGGAGVHAVTPRERFVRGGAYEPTRETRLVRPLPHRAVAGSAGGQPDDGRGR